MSTQAILRHRFLLEANLLTCKCLCKFMLIKEEGLQLSGDSQMNIWFLLIMSSGRTRTILYLFWHSQCPTKVCRIKNNNIYNKTKHRERNKCLGVTSEEGEISPPWVIRKGFFLESNILVDSSKVIWKMFKTKLWSWGKNIVPSWDAWGIYHNWTDCRVSCM